MISRIVEWAALLFALIRALRGDIAGVTLGILLAVYARQHRKGLDQ